MHRLVSFIVLVSVFFLGACAAKPQVEPALVIIVSIDQMRADRMNESLPGGLGRLMREGFVFSRATLDHGLTNTCTGHVAMSTGMNPSKTGIPSNSYTDHTTGAERYCVDDPGTDNTVLGTDETRSPNALTASTLGDWLKERSENSKVFAVSAKDRAAIPMGGKNADGVYWFHQGIERFTSSRYYHSRLPGYLDEFNGDSFFEDGYGGSIPSKWLHDGGSLRMDDYRGEATMNLRVSGHPLNDGERRADQVYSSPYIDLATGELARMVLKRERLGRRGVTDLLAVSYSATDAVGHLYGPFSAESEDTLKRLDAEIGLFLDMLDSELDGNYVLALSADHGVQALPEWQRQQGDMKCPEGSGRIDMYAMAKSIYGHLAMELRIKPEQIGRLIGFSAAGTTINAAVAAGLGLTVAKVRDTLEAFYESQPSIVAAWTEDEIMSSDNEFARLYRNSYIAGLSGHLIAQNHEDCLIWFSEGTTHNSPWMYDRAVPLVFYGRGVSQGLSDVSAHSIDIAPTLADFLDLETPDSLDGKSRKAMMTAR